MKKMFFLACVLTLVAKPSLATDTVLLNFINDSSITFSAVLEADGAGCVCDGEAAIDQCGECEGAASCDITCTAAGPGTQCPFMYLTPNTVPGSCDSCTATATFQITPQGGQPVGSQNLSVMDPAIGPVEGQYCDIQGVGLQVSNCSLVHTGSSQYTLNVTLVNAN